MEVDEEEGEEGEVPFDTSMTLTVFRWITGLVWSEVSGGIGYEFIHYCNDNMGIDLHQQNETETDM